MAIRIGIAGYGNLGKSAEAALANCPDMELVGVFTRRDPKTIQTKSGVKTYLLDEAKHMKDEIDVMLLCGGSATDLPVQGPEFAQYFNTVDSFDTHANIPDYFKAVDAQAQANGHVSIISVGWDPGLFSINRLFIDAILPTSSLYTFWGKGVSQGHSDAIRRIAGVKNAKQYTIPIEKALNEIRSGQTPALTARQKHLRECFVVAEDGADKAKIENEIKTMPNYFADYDTIVHFISEDEFVKEHSGMAHGGFVIGSEKASENINNIIEYSLKLDSNPDFTSRVLLAYARAAYCLSQEGQSGAKTVFDIAPKYLSPKPYTEIVKELL